MRVRHETRASRRRRADDVVSRIHPPVGRIATRKRGAQTTSRLSATSLPSLHIMNASWTHTVTALWPNG